MSAPQPTHKLVDGVVLELTPAEIVELKALWALNQPPGEPEPEPAPEPDQSLETPPEPEPPHAKRRTRR